MTNLIQWTTAESPAPDETIANVESALGNHYPEDFLAVARTAHGGSPTRARFSYFDPQFGRVGTSLGVLLSLNPSSTYYVLRKIQNLDDGLLPSGVVPFGEDGGGDLMAFDFRKDANNPPVVYVAIADAEEVGERHVYPLAPSFSAFLDMLEDD
jgi:SMI1-KNR4 cell-wall